MFRQKQTSVIIDKLKDDKNLLYIILCKNNSVKITDAVKMQKLSYQCFHNQINRICINQATLN